MEAYLDNAATTRAFDSVTEIMVKTLKEDFGNPSSMHQKGVDAEKYITQAKQIIADSLKVDTKEIVFTSGGTESNNLALIGTALGYRRSGNHIITTNMEHPSVYNPLIHLEEQGFRVTYLPVDRTGRVEEAALLEAICDDTILVSIMYVNNEVGSVQDIARLSKIAKEKKKDIIFHVDAIQAYGKYKIAPRKMGIDLLSISGHKIHGPKGIGVLYIKDRTKVKPILFGGGQQKGMRSGTENVPGIAGLGAAVKEIYTSHEEKVANLFQLKKQLVEGLEAMDGTTVNALTEDRELKDTAPHIISVSFAGVRSEVLLHALEEKHIYVSSGSACASNHPQISGTLKAIKVKSELLDSTIRFSLSVHSTQEEVEYTLETIQEILPILRRFSRH